MSAPHSDDDSSISDEEWLYRRTVPGEEVLFDEVRQRRRPPSSVFMPDSDTADMSVYVASRIAELKLQPEACLEGHPGFGLVRFRARIARAAKLHVKFEEVPLHEQSLACDSAHGIVAGFPDARKARRNCARMIAYDEETEWLTLPN